MSMDTDIPPKVLARVRAADLLPLLGARVLRVRSVDLPSTAKRPDTLLWLRSPSGRRYRLLVERQGYHDPLLLGRVLEYFARLGPQEAEADDPLPVVIIYVGRRADVGDRLVQVLDGAEVACVCLWGQDAAAVGSGLAALAALSPLMGGATGELMERAGPGPGAEQGDLLGVLGALSEGLVSTGAIRAADREGATDGILADGIPVQGQAGGGGTGASRRASREQGRAGAGAGRTQGRDGGRRGTRASREQGGPGDGD